MLPALAAVARAVGLRLLEWRKSGGSDGHWEGAQFKAKADALAHDALLRLLSHLDPKVPVLSEEDAAGRSGPRPERYFLIDPIDGTASYAQGFVGFVTQIALIEAGQVRAGVVHAPALGLTWTAELGRGAFLGETPLHCALLPDRLLLIDNYPTPQGVAARLHASLPATGYVESGSLGLKACRIADGSADLFVKDVKVRDWDMAPAEIILREAGGVLTDSKGRPLDYGGTSEVDGIIASVDGRLASRALEILQNRDTHED